MNMQQAGKTRSRALLFPFCFVLRFLYFKKFLILIKADFEFEPSQPFPVLALGETIQAHGPARRI